MTDYDTFKKMLDGVAEYEEVPLDELKIAYIVVKDMVFTFDMMNDGTLVEVSETQDKIG
jgi:hypothetical protein